MDSTVHAIPIALDQLRLSPLNARRIGSKPLDDLAASILAEGLLQKLTVTENDAGEYEVVAGKRRLGALMLLRERGQLPPELQTPPCRIVHDGRATSASLAENIMREPMHPADEFEAFKRLADQERSVEEIAQEFGTTPTVVLRRLKLASVAPELFDLFRKDEIRLDQMMALALTDDHAKQLAAWNVKAAHERTADRIRDRLMAKKEFRINADSAAKFVGIDALEAAGVIVRRDLFSERGEGFVTDRKHVDELALAKLEEEAERVRAEGWKWVEARIAFGYSEEHKFGRIHADGGKAKLSKECEQELNEVEKQLDAIHEKDEDSAGRDEALDDEFDRLDARARYLRAQAQVWTDKQKSAAGAIVALRDGCLQVERGLIKPGDAKPKDERGRDSHGSAKASKKPGDLSQPLIARLIAQRTAILQAEVLANVDVSLAILAHQLLLGAFFSRTSFGQSATRISFAAPEAIEAKADELPSMRYYNQTKDCIEVLKQTLPPATKLLGWLLEQPRDDVVRLIAAATSQSIDTSMFGEAIGTSSALMPLIEKLDVDFAEHWEASPATLFNHLPRAAIEHIVRDACGAPALKNLEHLNKAQVVEAATQLLAGKRWLPKPMRLPKKAAGEPAAEKPVRKKKSA